ncbi:MAG: FdhF/YdeP family oxidoreductase [Phycisphaerales bacterium]|nr:FdhF/YdeP family oxidoreductase [Phycisphaerales bacterium]
MKRPRSGGGWAALKYTFRKGGEAGGLARLYRALRTKNACKTCALGMGGQKGGLVNERGHFPEVCKKSMQAMVADMQGKIEPAYFERYGFAELRTFSPRDLEMSGRIGQPMFAGPDDRGYRPIDWDAALDFCARRLKAVTPDETFFYFSGRSSNEAAFLWQLFARLYGTNNVNNCSYYCHQASGVGLSSALGSGTATITLDDLYRCDLVFLIGGNPASNHPRLMGTLADVRRRGGKVIVINPLVETGLVNFRVPSKPFSLMFGSEIASQYIQPHIGGDIAVLTGIAKSLLERHPQAVDESFIAAATENADAFREAVNAIAWDDIERRGGVARKEIDRAADTYANSKAAVFAWTMGITHHVHGVDNVRAIVNLALLRGMVGRPHAGLLPIRGHSNVQGVGSVGVTPKLKDDILRRLETHFDVKTPTTPGLDTLECMRAMATGSVKNAFCLGGNLFGSNPDARVAAEAFSRLESCVYLSTTLNTGHAWGRAKETLILPVKARDEESQPTTQESMFNYVRLSDGGPARIAEARGEVEIVAAIARRVLPTDCPVDFAALENHGAIRAALAKIIPGYEAIGDIDRTKQEFQIEGRTFHTPQFATPSGKARFHAVPLPADALETETGDLGESGAQLRLMTIRSEGQFNTVVYEEEDLYRGQDRRDVILLNEADMREIGVSADEPVIVRSVVGEMRALARPYPVTVGNAAMYFPEANLLVPAVADRESRTPAFKAVAVRVRRA